MKNLLIVVAILALIHLSLRAQSLDTLMLSSKEIPKEYVVSKEVQCVSVQACSFYQQTDLYGMIIGKVKRKEIQYFKSENDAGSIMYFEFEDKYSGSGFLEGLLWGEESKPTTMHPEEFLVIKNNILIIWSCKKDSKVKAISMEKVKALSK